MATHFLLSKSVPTRNPLRPLLFSIYPASSQPKQQDKLARHSKYIAGLLETAQHRKREQDVLYERRMVKERKVRHMYRTLLNFFTQLHCSTHVRLRACQCSCTGPPGLAVGESAAPRFTCACTVRLRLLQLAGRVQKGSHTAPRVWYRVHLSRILTCVTLPTPCLCPQFSDSPACAPAPFAPGLRPHVLYVRDPAPACHVLSLCDSPHALPASAGGGPPV